MLTREHLDRTFSDFVDVIKNEMKRKLKHRQANVVLGYNNKKKKDRETLVVRQTERIVEQCLLSREEYGKE